MSEGIQGYSSPCPLHIIFSISDCNAVEFHYYLQTRPSIKKELIAMRGCYKGVEEHSYALPFWAWKAMNAVRPAFMADQESVLELGKPQSCNHRPAVLIYLESGKRVELGNFRSVAKEIALQQDAWTSDLAGNNFWICSPGNSRSIAESYDHTANRLHAFLHDNPALIERVKRNMPDFISQDSRDFWQLVLDFMKQTGGYAKQAPVKSEVQQ